MAAHSSTGLLYLSESGVDFEGGLFAFLDGEGHKVSHATSLPRHATSLTRH